MNKKQVSFTTLGRQLATKTLAIGCIIAVHQGFSQDSLRTQKLNEVVVTGTRFDVPVEKSGKTIYKVTADDIEKNAGKSVADILNEVPGIQMGGNFGSPGTNISLFVRGGSNKNTLILIDGVPLNDPSGITASYDLRLLPISQIESIEVLKGGLSTLYGTGASAAVINISLKENKGEKLAGGVNYNYGSYNTIAASGNIQGKANKLTYLLSANYSNSDGFSSALEQSDTSTFTKDGFNQKNGLLKLGYTFNKQFAIDGIVAYDDFETDYDGGAFIDADNQQLGNMCRVGLIPTFKYAKGQIQLKTMYVNNSSEFISASPKANDGKNLQLDLSQRHYLTSTITGVWGISRQEFSYKQGKDIDFAVSKFSSIDPYASFFYEHRSGFNLHVGARLNTHSEYGSKFVYNANPSYLIKVSQSAQVKLLASISTSYITPTGYQLFAIYGNTNLKPEEALNLELGGSLYLNKSLVLNVVYFDRNENSVIDFVSKFDNTGAWIGGAYDNLTKERHVKGYEADLSYNMNKMLSFSANYTHASADDATTFYRIPEDKFGFSANISPLQNTTASLKYNFTGMRTIFDFGKYEEVKLESYGLIDIYVQQKFLYGKLIGYGALNNVLDKDFVSIYGFTTRGRNFNIGMKYNF